MRIGIVIQRYGAEVLGGSEQLCRLLAERLCAQHDVEVLTTCARDYITWKNEYPEGTDRIRGVAIRRFANARVRDLESFNRYSDWIYSSPHTKTDEIEWLKQQGPWCPNLVEYLRKHQQQYDVLMFFTYLYAPTVMGLEVNPAKSILVSTAHDEPAIRLEIFKDVFSRPAAICYLTTGERDLVQDLFPERPLLEDVLGVGVDPPQEHRYPRMPGAVDAGQRAHDSDDASIVKDEDDESEASEFPLHLVSRGSMFRRRHRLHGPVALYGGRIDPGKGCEELLHYFAEYIKVGGEGTLALMGAKMMPLIEEPYIRFAGLLSDRERGQALEAATVVVCPSPYESLSLLALEAMSAGTPVLVNARSTVLVEHCVKSNGGLWYADRDEFVECMKLLMRDARLRETLGRNGREYVKQHYRWDVVLARYERLFSRVHQAK